MRNIKKRETSWFLATVAKHSSSKPLDLAHQMTDATLEQLDEIVKFADRLKLAAYALMHNRELEASGVTSLHLDLPPEGYSGYRPKA